MNTSIFLYDNVGTDEFINTISTYIQNKEFHDGQVGNHVNLNQKRRKDLFIKEPSMLRNIEKCK